MEFLHLARLPAISRPGHCRSNLLLSLAFVGKLNGVAPAYGSVLLVKLAESIVDGIAVLRPMLFLNARLDGLKTFFIAPACLLIHRVLLQSLGIAVNEECLLHHTVYFDRTGLKAYFLPAAVLVLHNPVG